MRKHQVGDVVALSGNLKQLHLYPPVFYTGQLGYLQDIRSFGKHRNIVRVSNDIGSEILILSDDKHLVFVGRI